MTSLYNIDQNKAVWTNYARDLILSTALTSDQIYLSFGAETKDKKPKETKSDSKPKKEDKSKDNAKPKETDKPNDVTKSKDEDKTKEDNNNKKDDTSATSTDNPSNPPKSDIHQIKLILHQQLLLHH